MAKQRRLAGHKSFTFERLKQRFHKKKRLFYKNDGHDQTLASDLVLPRAVSSSSPDPSKRVSTNLTEATPLHATRRISPSSKETTQMCSMSKCKPSNQFTIKEAITTVAGEEDGAIDTNGSQSNDLPLLCHLAKASTLGPACLGSLEDSEGSAQLSCSTATIGASSLHATPVITSSGETSPMTQMTLPGCKQQSQPAYTTCTRRIHTTRDKTVDQEYAQGQGLRGHRYPGR